MLNFRLTDEAILRAHVERHQTRLEILRRGTIDLRDIDERIRNAENSLGRVQGDVMIIPITGEIEYKLSLYGWCCGGTSVLGITRALRMGLADPNVTKIVLDVDSPGGEYSGVPELGDLIYASRGIKPIYSIANPCAASAAVWIASAAERFTCTRSGFAGSIGTIMPLVSVARYYQELGVDIKLIRNPQFKCEGSGLEPISEEYAAHSQQVVDRITLEFQTAVGKYRGVKPAVVKETFGQGRMLASADAKAVGLIDAISDLETECKPGKGTRNRGARASLSDAEPQLQRPRT